MRKVIELNEDTVTALKSLAETKGTSVDALLEEAARLLLRKHQHPRTLKEALTLSLRQFGTNDNADGADHKKRAP